LLLASATQEFKQQLKTHDNYDLHLLFRIFKTIEIYGFKFIGSLETCDEIAIAK
jgi:DUF1009 family protein